MNNVDLKEPNHPHSCRLNAHLCIPMQRAKSNVFTKSHLLSLSFVWPEFLQVFQGKSHPSFWRAVIWASGLSPETEVSEGTTPWCFTGAVWTGGQIRLFSCPKRQTSCSQSNASAYYTDPQLPLYGRLRVLAGYPGRSSSRFPLRERGCGMRPVTTVTRDESRDLEVAASFTSAQHLTSVVGL